MYRYVTLRAQQPAHIQREHSRLRDERWRNVAHSVLPTHLTVCCFLTVHCIWWQALDLKFSIFDTTLLHLSCLHSATLLIYSVPYISLASQIFLWGNGARSGNNLVVRGGWGKKFCGRWKGEGNKIARRDGNGNNYVFLCRSLFQTVSIVLLFANFYVLFHAAN